MRTSHAWIAAYAVTGALQPLLVDRLKQQGLAPARLLGPMMANLIGMTLVAPAREACVGSPAPIAQTVRASWRTYLEEFRLAVLKAGELGIRPDLVSKGPYELSDLRDPLTLFERKYAAAGVPVYEMGLECE